HLKYAVEVSKTSSITKAADNLYMGQPNLSRAIRELEESLGIQIFKRTPKGIYPTQQGEEFLGYAKKILAQVDAVEKMYRGEKNDGQKFAISVPRASYISAAFSEFVKKLDKSRFTDIFYKETNSMRAINNIINADYNLGILRYRSSYDRYFKEMLESKGLESELICEFKYILLMSQKSPLASKESICLEDLKPYLEVAHADPYVPTLPMSTVQKEELSDGVEHHIFVFERGSQMELLSSLENTFMWTSPIPKNVLERFGLVQRVCVDAERKYKDVLIRHKDYMFTSVDKLFIDELMRSKRHITDVAK
ncbi:MAG: LysR family transcriptional regulator, partial [Eubacteriales bacterium]